MPSNYPKFPINLGAYTDTELENMKATITRILRERRAQKGRKKSSKK